MKLINEFWMLHNIKYIQNKLLLENQFDILLLKNEYCVNECLQKYF